MLMWKIVVLAKVSALYIYIDYADNDRGGGCAQKGKGNSCIRI